jgi:hypothetical protein
MAETYSSPSTPYLKIASRIYTIGVLFISIAVFTGWCIQNEFLKRVMPGVVAMNPVTSVCFILAAASLKAIHRIQTPDTELFICNKNFPEGRLIKVSAKPVIDREGKVIAGQMILK